MTKKNSTNHVTLGKLGTTHGINGWIRVYSETDNPESIFDYQDWSLYNTATSQRQPIKALEWKAHQGHFICKFDGYDSPEAAKTLTNLLIQVEANELPQLNDDEYYWSQLIGLEIIDQHGQSLGKVSNLMETGSNDVLIVKGEKEHAIPYLPWVIKAVDLEKQQILVDWEII